MTINELPQGDLGMIFEYKNSKPTYTDKEQP